jgi:hypothetical protein
MENLKKKFGGFALCYRFDLFRKLLYFFPQEQNRVLCLLARKKQNFINFFLGVTL